MYRLTSKYVFDCLLCVEPLVLLTFLLDLPELTELIMSRAGDPLRKCPRLGSSGKSGRGEG